MLRLLDSLSLPYLHEPAQLKQLLCPLVAHSKADQERFYELFDQYWEELARPWELQPPPKAVAWWHRIPAWMRWLLPTLLLTGAGWGIWEIMQPPVQIPEVAFTHPPAIRMDESIRFENLSKNLDTTAMRWEVFDKSTGQREFVEEDSFHLTYRVKNIGAGPDKEIRLTGLTAIDYKTGDTLSFASPLTILCAQPPIIRSINAPKEGEIKTEITFQAVLPEPAGLELKWDFGDESTAAGSSAKHAYANPGNYVVSFTAIRPGASGVCQTSLSHPISIDQNMAIIAAKPLIADTMSPIVSFSWGTWILLGLLGLAMIWYWVKWATRKAPPVPEEKEDLAATAERFRAADKAPYFIPFRPQEGHIRVERELYRLADVLRLRQEGLRKEFNIPDSVKKTIEEGGFPRLLTRADTVPTEYLFLLDEQAYPSHQRRLFEFTVTFLQDREVLGELFYFNSRLHSFWNQQHPQGISPLQLRRLYPYHRIIVLSDAYALLDPNAVGKPALRAEARDLFLSWKYRLLLTHTPVVSWTYREGALHELFAIFPADTEGLGEAIKHIERGIEDEERSTYSSWCKRLMEGRKEPDINYRTWRTAADHKDYLKDYPALYRWLCAIAVYPKPDWNITLAIGRALSAADPRIIVNYDNLLIISHAPWLKTGDLSPRLRRELLADLDPDTEKVARAAVQSELKAVEALVQGSHVNQEYHIALALQNFALAPADPESQAAVRQLLALNLLTPRHITDLNTSVERYMTEIDEDIILAKTSPQTPDIQRFLEENKTKPTPPEKPFFTRDFWLASAASLLYLLIFLFAWNLGGTKRLADWVGVDSTDTPDCQEEFLKFYFLKKQCAADSAVLYNNAGVELYKKALAKPQGIDKLDSLLYLPNRLVDAMFNFQRALVLRPDYELAKANMGKAHFLTGKAYYDDYLESPSPDRLHWALQSFLRAAPYDSIAPDAMHGAGLCYFYQEKLDSAKFYRDELLRRTDGQYFNRLETYPHLQSLLAILDKANIVQTTIYVTDARTKRPLPGVTVALSDFTGSTSRNGSLSLPLVVQVQRSVDFSKKGYKPLQGQRFTPAPENLQWRVQLEPETTQTATPRSNASVIYFDADKTTLRPDARQALDSVSTVLIKNLTWALEITGVASGNGSAAYNQQIARRLADAVSNYLAGKGITRDRLNLMTSTQAKALSKIQRNNITNNSVTLRIIQPVIAESLPPDDDTQADDDEDGVPNKVDQCPNEAGTPENNGCLPKEAPVPLPPPVKTNWRLIKTSFVAEPKILKNRNFYDTLFYDNYDYRITLEELRKDGSASFALEKDLKMEARHLAPVSLPGLKKGAEEEFTLDNHHFRFVYLGQERRRVNAILRDVAVYAFYSQGEARQQPSTFAIPQMVFVKGGSFRMGCDKKQDGGCVDDEEPVHDVILNDFFIGKYEVTNEEFAVFLQEYDSETVISGANAGVEMIQSHEWGIEIRKGQKGLNVFRAQKGYEKHPVVNVSWFGANEYAKWLSEKTGQTFRLPTEAEWEYAARGGPSSKYNPYSGNNNPDRVGWYSKNAGGQTHPVGQKAGNELGISDMSGNVYEWCNDRYDSNYYKQSAKGTRNPIGPDAGSNRVIRGGSWGDAPVLLRNANRGGENQAVMKNNTGFRLVKVGSVSRN